jgi:hypothetical protein
MIEKNRSRTGGPLIEAKNETRHEEPPSLRIELHHQNSTISRDNLQTTNHDVAVMLELFQFLIAGVLYHFGKMNRIVEYCNKQEFFDMLGLFFIG